MERREFLKFLSLALPALSGCALTRIDPNHILLRSDVIDSMEQERAIRNKAHLARTADGRIRVLFVQGTPYERGYQHGVLLRDEIKANLGYLYDRALAKFHFEELFAEAYERMRPFIPDEYIEEMHGLAHGSRLPLHVIHHIHALPEIGEWGGKRRFKYILRDMIAGKLGTSCSNFCASGGATADGGFYVVRVLDWGMHKISRLHEYPLITVGKPDKGNIYCNIGWIGFLGAISGMNSQQITLGEMGYGDPPNETMHGEPMPFLLRDVLTYGSSLADVRKIISTHPGTNSFVYLMSDGKSGEAELYIRDRDRFLVFKPGEEISDNGHTLPPIAGTVYGGHYHEKMTKVLGELKGTLTPDVIMQKVIPEIAMPSNFQDVVYAPKKLQFWVANAHSKEERAAEQPYSFFDFGEAIKTFG